MTTDPDAYRRDDLAHEHGGEGGFAVRDNPPAQRYEAVRGGEVLGILTYARSRGSIELIHTVTDPEHRSEGAASLLVRTVLAEARQDGLTVEIVCPFVESWLTRHPHERRGLTFVLE